MTALHWCVTDVIIATRPHFIKTTECENYH